MTMTATTPASNNNTSPKEVEQQVLDKCLSVIFCLPGSGNKVGNRPMSSGREGKPTKKVKKHLLTGWDKYRQTGCTDGE